jgi:hypothetical protein
VEGGSSISVWKFSADENSIFPNYFPRTEDVRKPRDPDGNRAEPSGKGYETRRILPDIPSERIELSDPTRAIKSTKQSCLSISYRKTEKHQKNLAFGFLYEEQEKHYKNPMFEFSCKK